MEGTLDLQAKFKKLAAEYSKLRSQIPVLKRAYTNEQTRCNEMKDFLRIKDQNLRIAESEMDSLTFRNQQLTCRVSMLLQELEEVKSSSKRCIQKTQNDYLGNFQAIDEEFSKKIAENAALVSTLNECKEKHENEVKKLNATIDKLKIDLNSVMEKNCNCKPLNNWIDDFDLMRLESGEDKEKNILDGGTSCDIEKQSKNSEGDKQDSVGFTIQKALQDQLLDVEQQNNRLTHETNQLSYEKKSLELKIKELTAKCQNGRNQLVGAVNFIPTEEMHARENEIKLYYEEKLKAMASDVAQAKSRIDVYSREIKSIKQRLDLEHGDVIIYKDISASHRQSKAALEDELKTTKERYETQITTMSEHIASLNDTIQSQKDEIENLKHLFEPIKRNKK